jgi:predicted ATPase/DNA-binding CsgD family transcriptional regulator/Tfp pilus assembly protein PilF
MNGRNPDRSSPTQSLTEREQEVLGYIGDGLTNRQIAERLTVTQSTVKWYVRQIYNKLGVESRNEAVAQGRRVGLLATTARPDHNLPLQPTPFIGREPELAALANYLADPAIRLITIFGVGGMGKTRLALAAAKAQVNSPQQPHPFPDGVYFISLAHVETPDLLVPAIADAICFSFYEGSEPQAQLLHYLGQKTLLLLLDNFEQMPASLALLDEIRQTAPAVKLLVTSRTGLNVQAEQLFPIAGLAYPDEEDVGDAIGLDHLAGYSAIQLFNQCARRIDPAFALTGDNQADVLAICRLVQGMPLGIVLAATWLAVLPPREIAAEMRHDLDFLATDLADMPERQRSLRGTFDHSWRLLNRREQAVFAQLSVFRGGFSREAAQAVSGASLRDLRILLNHSLLNRTLRGRYEIHKLLEQFATEKLAQLLAMETAVSPHPQTEIDPLEQAVPDVYQRHSAYFSAYVQEKGQKWRAARHSDTLQTVAQEFGNIRRAWRWAVAAGKTALVQQMAADLFWFYDWRNQYKEGELLFQLAVEQFCPSQQPENAWTAGLLVRWARFVTRLADYETARPVFEDAVRHLRQMDNPSELALALNFWGDLERLCGAYDPARSLLEESLTLYRQLNHAFDLARVLNHLAMVVQRLGEYTLSTNYARESLTLCQLAHDRRGEAAALYSLGYAAYELGDFAAAEDFYSQSLTLRRDLGDLWGTAAAYNNLGIIYYDKGEFDQAETSWRQCLAIRQELGDTRGTAVTLNNLGLIAEARRDYHQAEQWYRQSLYLCRDLGNRQGVSIALNNLGEIATAQGHFEQAYSYHQESLAVAREIAYTRSITFALDFLGQVAIKLFRLPEALGYYQEALHLAWETKALSRMLKSLLGLATVLLQTGDVEQAVRLSAIVANHPSTEETTRGQAQAMLNQYGPMAATAEPATESSLEQVVAELLSPVLPG